MSELFPIFNKKQYHAYLQSSEWRNTSLAIRKRDGHKCTECGDRFNLHVHHKTYERVTRELPGDLITLCRKCHAAIHESQREARELALDCREFLKQSLRDDINPFPACGCRGCAVVWPTYDEYLEAVNGFEAYRYAGILFCRSCIAEVRRLLVKSKMPELTKEIISVFDLWNGWEVSP